MRKWALVFLVISFTITIIFASRTAEAANWEVIIDKTNYYIAVDTESLAGGQNGPREAWFKLENKYTNATSLTYMMFYSDKTACTTDAILGSRTVYSRKSCSPERIIPDSDDEKLWKYLYK